MKLWIYWMDNNYQRHYEERVLPDDGGDNRVDLEDVSWKLNCALNSGNIKDYQVELRK